MAVARAIRCSECRRTFHSDERAPYIGYDHLLDEHRDLLVEGRIDEVSVRRIQAPAAAASQRKG